MPINLDNILAKKADYLLLREKNAEIIANNIANADTPGFKAVSTEFSDMLKKAQYEQAVTLKSTHEKHLTKENRTGGVSQYKIPLQPDTGDGNTVDITKERNLFLVNSLEYQYGVRSVDGLIKGIKKALTGGNS